MAEFPLILKGPRIELRALEPTFENANITYKVVVDNREHLIPWMDWAEEKNYNKPEHAFEYLQKINQGREKGYKFDFGIFFDKKYIGNISIFDISDKNKSGEIGYWLAKSASGKGYVTEAVKLLEDASFEYGLNRIQIKCDTKNVPSANVAKRLGYNLDGELRENLTLNDESFRNTYVFSKLKSEWGKEKKL